MSNGLHRITAGTRRNALTALAVAGLVAVPLAVAGLFAGAFGSANDRVDTIPAIVVNNDEMVSTTGADGAEQNVLAGRQLVTQLTGGDDAGFDWTISNTASARRALADGSAYAVLTIPEDFSASITSLSTATPRQANIEIRTDDAHSYLAGSTAQALGQAMSGAFGRAITERYLAGFYRQLGTMGTSLHAAADGATDVATGAGDLAKGLDTLASGAGSAAAGAADAASGAASLSGGVADYTSGVDTLADGLGDAADGARGLDRLGDGWSQYTDGVGQAAAGFEDLRSAILADPANSSYAQSLAGFQDTLDTLAEQGRTLSGQTDGALGSVQDGIAQGAAGANALSDQSAALRTGASDLAAGVSTLSGGVTKLASGTSQSAAGAHRLSDGARTLATGLGSGADQADAAGDQDPAATAHIVAEPVTVSTSRANAIDGIGPVIGMLAVPISLWIGALVIFLFLRPVTALGLASTAPTLRLVLRGLWRTGGIVAGQAVVVVALLHGTLGVHWSLLPATLAFGLLTALAFTSVHYLLAVGLGRAGVVVSLVLLALQLTSAGGLYPIEVVAGPFRAASPFLPLTWAVQGMQGIVSGGHGVGAAVTALFLFAVAAAALSLGIVSARRREVPWRPAVILKNV